MARSQKGPSNGRMDQSQRQDRRKSPNSKRKKASMKKDMDYSRDKEYDSPSNDPEWYAQTPELMQLAANIPFSHAAGTTYNLDIYNDDPATSSQITSADQTVPGLMVLYIIPTPSSANDPSSPLNIAATSLFSYVRHANSGRANYNAPDLMLYCLAMGQVYSYINYLQRVYGSMNLYANMNRYLPRAIVEAQGVNFNNILQNLPNFKYGIDALIQKAASMAVPASLTYFRRLAFMFSGIYAEGETIKDQLYMYSPLGFMQYSETTEETGGSLEYLALWKGRGALTYTDLIDYGNKLLDPIISSESMNIMSGDVLKAYGDSGILKLATLPEVYQINIVTDLTVLEQFQNSGRVGSPTICKIIQTQKGLSGSLVSQVSVPYNNIVMGLINSNKPLTTILTNPNAGDVMERTRLMVYGYQDDSSETTMMRIQMATEVPVALQLYYINPTSGALNSLDVPMGVNVLSTWTQANVSDALNLHCMLENFKFHPAVYYFSQQTNTVQYVNMALDVDNYAIVNVQDLERMNEAALLSMFNVNSVAKAY